MSGDSLSERPLLDSSIWNFVGCEQHSTSPRSSEPSPLHTTTIVEKCTLKLVAEYKHMLCQATEPISTFLENITYVFFDFFFNIISYVLFSGLYSPIPLNICEEKSNISIVLSRYGHMIDNVVLIVTGTLHERDVQELLEKCHPLGMFDSIATLAVAQNMRELYRLVLADTPLAPYFSECITSEDLDDMNIEIMRNTLYKAYLEDFYKFCQLKIQNEAMATASYHIIESLQAPWTAKLFLTGLQVAAPQKKFIPLSKTTL
ncbi:hypothetical protein Dsin_007478 [Dipteronia sinensis]|uniref:Uncharacterized protein n=1 Tax=Dipteronia sinensis TaxID=43782 RepID=A0AAE0EGL7_9ROSI|nr:hypothetical protein Dsin_007478 [Dipteronia sinensis]